MTYKNTSLSVKTFYGEKFQPGEVKEVPGYINDPDMIIADKVSNKEPTKSVAAPVAKGKSENKNKAEQS